MTSILKRIGLRARKLLILLICLPLLAGVVAAYLESKTPPSFTGQATVKVGSYEDEFKPQSGNATNAETHIKSKSFIKDLQKYSNTKLDINNIKSRLVVTAKGTDFLVFQYTGADQHEVDSTLSGLTNAFYQSSKKHYYKTKRMLESSLADARKETVQNADRARVEYDLQVALDHLEAGEIVDPVTVMGSYNNPLKRGIFGVVLGLMLDIAILIIPEIFREYR